MVAKKINDGGVSCQSCVESGEAGGAAVPGGEQLWGQSLTIVLLLILVVVSVGGLGWLYKDNRVMSESKSDMVKQNYSAVMRVEAIGEDMKFYKEKMALLEDQNAGLVESKKGLRLEIAELMSQVAGFKLKGPFKAENESVMLKNVSLAKVNEELAGKVAILTDQVNKSNRVYRQRLIELQGKNDKITAKNISLLGENAQLIGRYDEISAEKVVLLEENAELSLKNENVLTENATLIAKNAEIDGLNAELISANGQLSVRNDVLLTQKTELAEVTKDITVENIALSKKNERLAKRKSLPEVKRPVGLSGTSVADMLASVEPEGRSRFVGREKNHSKPVVIEEK